MLEGSELRSAATVLVAGAAFAAPAQSAHLPKGAAYNILLVHGRPDKLEARCRNPHEKGYNVTLVGNPLTSLAADVDATKQALAKQDGKTVLVGLFWGAWSSRKPVTTPLAGKVSTIVLPAIKRSPTAEDT